MTFCVELILYGSHFFDHLQISIRVNDYMCDVCTSVHIIYIVLPSSTTRKYATLKS